jgi:hypothetical protein
MKNSGLSRALWLAWHPLELLHLILGSIIILLMIVISYVREAIDEAKK